MTPATRELFDEFVSIVRSCGPVDILVEQSRIAFHARMSFAVVVPRQKWLPGHLVLAEPVDDPRFHRVTRYSARNHVHEFRLATRQNLDATMRRHIASAYEVGEQRHGLTRPY